MELIGFCTVKETITRMKRHPTEWEKALVYLTSDTGLILKELV